MHPRIMIAAAAAAALLASGCAAEDAASPSEALGFVLHEGAVEPPGWTNYGAGLADLVPVGDCVIGLGLYNNGYHRVGVTWAGLEGCTELRLDPEPDDDEPRPEGAQGWGGEPFGSARSVIDYGDGVMVGIVGESVRRRGTDGQVTRLAEFDLPVSAPAGEGGDHAGLCGLADTGSGYLVSGFINEDHLLWRVAEDGTVTGPEPVEGSFCRMATGDDTVVTIANPADGERLAWRSLDGGATWETAPVEGLPGSAWVIDLRYADGAWRGIGATGEGPLELMLLDSTDGLHWTVTGRQEVGDGRAGDLTFDADGSPIVIGDRLTREDEKNMACNFVLTATGEWPELDWERGELGCTNEPVQAVATLADGRVLIASNRDLWIRPA